MAVARSIPTSSSQTGSTLLNPVSGASFSGNCWRGAPFPSRKDTASKDEMALHIYMYTDNYCLPAHSLVERRLSEQYTTQPAHSNTSPLFQCKLTCRPYALIHWHCCYPFFDPSSKQLLLLCCRCIVQTTCPVQKPEFLSQP